jgi:hypothetical protein
MIDQENMPSADKRYRIRAMVGSRYLRPSYSVIVVICILCFSVSALPIRAQRGASGGGSRGIGGGIATSTNTTFPPVEPGRNPNTEPGTIVPATKTTQKPVVNDDESCLPWNLPAVQAASVSVTSLGVTGKARSQYQKACDAFRKKKLADAEQHSRDAIQQYPKYPAAWVMLGEVLGDEQKMEEAHEACMQPMKTDAKYLPPYLCLAGLLENEKRWNDLLDWTDRFRGMNEAGDMYSNYYQALAFFQLHKLPEAQKSVSAAITMDTLHHQPYFYFLLSQIYRQQGDVVDATAQIQQFMKYASTRQDKDSAKEYLSELQSEQNLK